MDFTATVKDLRRALDQARRALSANPPLAAYTGVLVQVSGKHVLVSGSDGETTVTAKLECDVADEGRALVVPTPLAAYLDKAGGEGARVWLDDEGDVRVSVDGKEAYRFRQLSVTFPSPSLERQGLHPAGLADLADGLSRVRHAADGVVQLRSDDSSLTLVSTDKYRIAQVELSGAGFGSFSGVVPLLSLDHLAREDIDHIGIDSRGRVLRAKGPEVFVSARLVDEPFPDVAAIVDGPCRHQVTVKAPELCAALDRLYTVAARRPVKLEVATGSLTVSAANVELGAGREQVPVRGSVEPFSCFLNTAYLREAALAHRDADVVLGWNGDGQPIHLRSDDPHKVRAVVMPVRG